jgi:hypothetical protein
MLNVDIVNSVNELSEYRQMDIFECATLMTKQLLMSRTDRHPLELVTRIVCGDDADSVNGVNKDVQRRLGRRRVTTRRGL